MSTVILKGDEAIHYAETHNRTLNRYADDTSGALDGLSIDEARKIAAEHGNLIWIETHVGVNPGEQEAE